MERASPSIFLFVEDAALGLAGVRRLAAQFDAAPDIEVDCRLARTRLVALLDRHIGAVAEVFASRDGSPAFLVGSHVAVVDTETNRKIADVPVGKLPWGVAIP